MLVTRHNFDAALLKLTKEKVLSFDTETTCLPWWNNPGYRAAGVTARVFSMQFSSAHDNYYFDFNFADKLTDEHFLKLNDELTSDPEKLWFIANSKFDLHHSRNHCVEFAGTIHCTSAIARLCNNLEPKLSLDALSERYLGAGKLDVISILKERGHVTKIKKFGHNDKYDECLHFDRLELSELVDYGERDTRLCYDLGQWQIAKIKEIDETLLATSKSTLTNVYKNECALTKVLFEMEREGVKIDRPYTETAYEHEVCEYQRIEKELNQIAGKSVDWLSGKQLKPIFDAMGEKYSYTEKGNACFDAAALEDSESELAKLILKYRYHNKRAHTYFEAFLWLADANDILHADSQQAGTGFGRMSYWSPNLQNIPKRKDKGEQHFKVRRCFIPKPGKILADFDYTGAEYYLSMDYAREMPVVEMLKAGLDPHEKLRQDMNLKTRDEAKTMNFRVLYGAGQEAVGKALGYKGFEAKKMGKLKKNEYFAKLPAVAKLLDTVTSTAEIRGYIFNWLGRVLHYDRNTSYKAPNGLIQSGVGDMTKVAMVNIHQKLMPGKRSKMLLQVHDAILFELDPCELDLIDPIKQEMAEAYPHKVLPMKADAAFSDKSWADLQDELPT